MTTPNADTAKFSELTAETAQADTHAPMPSLSAKHRQFHANDATLYDRHLEVLAHQVADGVHARLALCCNCLDVPGLREIVSSEVFVMLQSLVEHQRAQAFQGSM